MRPLLSEPLPSEINGPYSAPNSEVQGDAHGHPFFPDGYSLWRVAGQLSAGAVIKWTRSHGDEAVYVIDGLLDLGGTQVGAETAVIVEAGVSGELRAINDSRYCISDQPQPRHLKLD